MINILRDEELLLKEKLGYFFTKYGDNGYINYNDLYMALNAPDKATYNRYKDKILKNQYVINLFKTTNEFNLIHKKNRMGYLILLLLLGKTTYIHKFRNKAIKTLTESIPITAIKNAIKVDVDTFVTNNFRMSLRNILKEVIKVAMKGGSIEELDGIVRTRYALERKKVKILKDTSEQKAKTAETIKELKEDGVNYYVYRTKPGRCEACGVLEGKVFKVEDLQIGVNAPPLHSCCRCWIDRHIKHPNKETDELPTSFDDM